MSCNKSRLKQADIGTIPFHPGTLPFFISVHCSMQFIYTHMRTHVMTWFTYLYTSVELLAVPIQKGSSHMTVPRQQQHSMCQVSLISACRKLHTCKAHLVVLQEKNNGELFHLWGHKRALCTAQQQNLIALASCLLERLCVFGNDQCRQASHPRCNSVCPVCSSRLYRCTDPLE